MSLFNCSFFSKTLCTMAKVTVYIPSPSSADTLKMNLEQIYQPKQKHKVLYLLHGMFEDETIWLRKSNIERYAQEKQIAVVMPYGENGYYTDMAHGPRWFTYLTEELPRFINANFDVSTDREDTFIAGLSMGGYGACKAAFTKPNLYSYVASLSGAVDVYRIYEQSEQFGMKDTFENIVGKATEENLQKADICHMAEILKTSQNRLPSVYIACGTEDEACYPMNIRLNKNLIDLGFDVTYTERPGQHTWDFWDTEIKKVLDWLPM